MCAGRFDPIPTWWHAVLVATVPIINACGWNALRRGDMRWPKLMGVANGFAIAISFVYALFYIPILPLAIIAVLFFGWGLLPLSPLAAFVVSCQLRRHLRLQFASSGGHFLAFGLESAPQLSRRSWS